MTDTRPRALAAGCEIKETIVDKKTVYQVVMPDGSIANNYDHPTRRGAERHRDLVDAFWQRSGRSER